MNARFKKEVTLSGPIGPGRSPGAKLVQEYLVINGIKLKIDGDWGPATAAGLKQFAGSATQVDQRLMDRLALPITRAATLLVGFNSLALAIVATARQNLAQHPIEVGGQNAGPWVRYYMDGFEGPSYPWCAGFVTRVIEQAAEGMAISTPVHLRRTYSCDVMASRAKEAARFVPGSSSEVRPGCLFLVRGSRKNDWTHTGIITGLDAQTFLTIEGNTNDEGSREGYEVCARTRNRANLDVVLL